MCSAIAPYAVSSAQSGLAEHCILHCMAWHGMAAQILPGSGGASISILSHEQAHESGGLAGVEAVHGCARHNVLLLRDEAPACIP